MTKPHRLVAEAIAAAEGEIVGRVRLQKIFYLLEQLGLKSGFSFSYHHYGPYSRALDEAIDAAKAFHGVREDIRRRGSDGAPFSVFVLEDNASVRPTGSIGGLPAEETRRLISLMKSRTSTVIELAATIHWLSTQERLENWDEELRRRKGAKTENGRTEAALDLLDALGLQPRTGGTRH